MNGQTGRVFFIRNGEQNLLSLDFLKWLNKPYPLIESVKWKLVLVVGFGVFVSVFLFLYQPYGASEIRQYRYLFLSGFGVSVSLGLMILYLIVPKLFPNTFAPESWQIKKEIVFLLVCFITTSVFNFIYNSTVGANIAPQHTLLEFVGITVSIGVFPLVILIFLVELYLNRKNAAQAVELTKGIKHGSNESADEFTIIPETIKSKHLTLKLEDFLFAKSDNNYSTFYFIKNGESNKALVRISLKRAEEQLASYDELIRCHNSYIVNKSKIIKIKGNARSLYARLDGYNELIPISRGFDKKKLLG